MLLGIGAAAALIMGNFRDERPLTTVAPREALGKDMILKGGTNYFRNETEPFTGLLIERFPDGILKSRSVLSNGVLNGLSEGFYTNGTSQVREYFVNGVSHGLRTKWFPDGQKLSEARIVSGRIEGVFRKWHENGVLAEEVHMSNNLPHGPSRSFYPSGSPKATALLDKGVPVESRFFNESNSAQNAVQARPN